MTQASDQLRQRLSRHYAGLAATVKEFARLARSGQVSAEEKRAVRRFVRDTQVTLKNLDTAIEKQP